MKSSFSILACCLLASSLFACTEERAASDAELFWEGRHSHTLTLGAADNSEVVRVLPDGQHALLVASKTRKVTLLSIGSALSEVRSQNLFVDDGGEGELTHIDVGPGGDYAALTRTRPIQEGGALVDCQGSLVFIDTADSEAFGTVLAEIPVGPMPDAVAISDDGRWIVTADEVDFNDDKCPLADIVPSVTVLELPDGSPSSARVRARITMVHEVDAAHREPEQVAFASDNDRVAVTLQDTQEVLSFRISELLSGAAEDGLVTRTSEEVTLTTLPNREDGAEPWPDGIARITDAAGSEHFLIAGEFNDTLHVIDPDGVHEAQIAIQTADMPGDLPRNLEDWCKAPFRPDSVAPFQRDGHHYVALSLKHAGAVGVWRVDDIQQITQTAVIKIGANEQGTPLTESSIGTEGISATPEGTILTANEGESSASLVQPL